MSLTFFDSGDVRVLHYPAGEPTVVSVDNMPADPTAVAVAVLRGADSDELLTVLLWSHSMARLGRRRALILPYLPAARADHIEHEVGFDAEVYAGLINSGGFSVVVTFDPHSEVMAGLIDNLRVISAADLIARYLPSEIRDRLVGVVIPDEGAQVRAGQVASLLGLPTFQAYKHRDFATGKLSGFSCDPLPAEGDVLVVDDICDGGGTFMGLAAAIPERHGDLHLWVTHGVFSGRAVTLLDHYKTVFTTDSHPGCHNLDAYYAATAPGAAIVIPVLTDGLTGMSILNEKGVSL